VGALDADEWTLPQQSPCIAALPYIDWSAPALGRVRVAATELQGICVLACSFNLADPLILGGLRGANLVEATLGHVPCSATLHELHCSGVLEATYASERALFQAIQDSPLRDRNRLSFQAGWLGAVAEPYDVAAVAGVAGARGRAAVAAVAAQPGPVELKFLHLTSWADILQESARHLVGQEARALARTVVLLSHREVRDVSRRDPASNVRAIASTLTTYVSAWASLGAGAAPAQLARHLPAYLVSSMAVLPYELAGPCGTALSCEAELRDSHTLLRGRVSEAAAVMWARIHSNIRMDARHVIGLKVWTDAFLHPPCTHQVVSDPATLRAKHADGRTFWGVALFVYCWCVDAVRVMVEQPRTVIPDYYIHPTQRLRPCDVGDTDNKPIHLFERGGRLVLDRDPTATGVSGPLACFMSKIPTCNQSLVAKGRQTGRRFLRALD